MCCMPMRGQKRFLAVSQKRFHVSLYLVLEARRSVIVILLMIFNNGESNTCIRRREVQKQRLKFSFRILVLLATHDFEMLIFGEGRGIMILQQPENE